MRTKEVLINIGLSITSLFVILLILEIGIRIVSSNIMIYDIEMHKYAKMLKRKSNVKGLTHEHIPNSKAKLMGVEVLINDLGFRDSELEEKRDNENRIILIGSSITMGWGVERNSVCDVVLENMYNKGQDTLLLNTINTGIGNYNTKLEEIRFRNIIDDLKANTVILHYYLNDAEQIGSNSQNYLIKYSYLAAFVYVKIKQLIAIKAEKFKTLGEYYKNLYLENAVGWKAAKESIVNMKNHCQEKGLNFMVLIQPDLHDLGVESDQNECHKIIHKFLLKEEIEYLDLLPYYRDKVADPQSIWISNDDPHPNAQGHKIIAKALYEYLKN